MNGSNPLVLTPINGEHRVHDLHLADKLGFSEPRMVRNLIKRNHDKLLKFGVCYAVEQTSGAQGGRPATEFYLNQKQAVFICMKSETERAFDVQIEIVRVFDAYLNGELKPVKPAAPDAVAFVNPRMNNALGRACWRFERCTDAFSKQVMVSNIIQLCEQMNLTIPPLHLIGKPANQFQMEV